MKTVSILAIIGSSMLLLLGLTDWIFAYYFDVRELGDTLEAFVILIFTATFYKRLKK